jgi:hypothetical protein
MLYDACIGRIGIGKIHHRYTLVIFRIQALGLEAKAPV